MATVDKTISLPSGTKLQLKSAAPRDAGKLGALRTMIRTHAAHLNASADEGRQSWLSLRREIAQAYDHPRRLLLLAWTNDALVGEIHMRAPAYERLRHDCRLALGVHTDFQNIGVGKALLKEGVAWAQGQPDLSRLSLSVHADNKVARSLYKKLGFEKEGVRRGAIGPKPSPKSGPKSGNETAEAIDEILMALYLTPK